MGLKLIRGEASDGGYVTQAGIHIGFRELEALRISALGLDNREAAEQMGISVNTFRNHVYGVMKKLGANNRANALLIAIENGMLEASHTQYLLGWSPWQWVYCWKCERAFPFEEALEVEGEEVVVDHVKWRLPTEYMCPYEGCAGKVWASWMWGDVREAMPEFPEIPERDKVYKVDWSRKEAYELQERIILDGAIKEGTR